ncbi:holin [Weizmannia sp. CD-2023]|uniref:holin n=1 Tax=Heyndrickxia TaxID=2837504 RepID=UPI002E1C46E8|nr:holin [Weizmannia sp. CD-2023]MED4899761.1 holin [Weizmannia sp. CD-2023]
MFSVAVIVAVIVGIGQLAKGLNMPTKFIPLLSLVLGIVAGIFLVDATSIQEHIFNGIMIGLSAAGLFDQTKIVTKE